jgi:hypothetical protein
VEIALVYDPSNRLDRGQEYGVLHRSRTRVALAPGNINRKPGYDPLQHPRARNRTERLRQSSI